MASPSVGELMTRFGMAAQLFQTKLEAGLAPYGLTIPQMSVLSHLVALAQPLRVTEIARAVEVGQPAVTKMLTKFEHAGWVGFITSAEDRRSKAVVATDNGRKLLAEVQQSIFPTLGGFFSEWKSEDLANFSEYLKKVIQLMDDRPQTNI